MKKLMTVMMLITLTAGSALFAGCSSTPKASEEPAVASAEQAPVALGASSAGRSR